jgi:uncharacterized membrane protein YciS (DUF1049 family)
MNFKLFLRTLVFLAIVFVMIYVGVHNTETVRFSFPLLSEKPIEQTAALIYFAIFSVGVLAGVVLGAGGGGKSRGGKEK